MTIKQAKDRMEQLANDIDKYLGELESANKTNSEKYETLLYIAGGLRELIEVKFN